MQLLSYASIGLFAYILCGFFAVVLIPMSQKAVGRLVISGLIACALLAANTSVLYIWHHFYR